MVCILFDDPAFYTVLFTSQIRQSHSTGFAHKHCLPSGDNDDRLIKLSWRD